MSDQKLLSKEELLAALKGAKNIGGARVKDADVPSFIRYFNIINGEDYINPQILYFLYKKWSSKALTYVKFKVIIKRYVTNNPLGFFYCSKEANFTSLELYECTKQEFSEFRQSVEKKEKKPAKHKSSSKNSPRLY